MKYIAVPCFYCLCLARCLVVMTLAAFVEAWEDTKELLRMAGVH